MATFVIYIDTPSWEFHFDPEHGSYHFEGRCSVRVFVFVGRPFAHPVDSHSFSPTSPYGDDQIFERARPHEEWRRRMAPAGSAVRDYPVYTPLSWTSGIGDPRQAFSEGSAPTPPHAGEGSEDSVMQPPPARRTAVHPGPGGRVRVPTPEALRPWIGYVPPY